MRRRGACASSQQSEEEAAAGVLATRGGGEGQLAGEAGQCGQNGVEGRQETGGGAALSITEKSREEEEGLFCNFRNLQGLNCKVKFPVDLGLK